MVLALLSATAVGAFFLTQSVAAANRELRMRDAATWYHEGEARLAAGRVDDAVTALRRACAIDRNQPGYRLALASALDQRGDDEPARQLLQGLRQLTPESVPVNLQLARIAARRNDEAQAVGFYQNALYGQWDADQLDNRPQIRVELIRYLLDHDRQGQALPELLVLSSNLTDAGPSHLEIGQLFVKAGEPRRALDHFERAIAANATDGPALSAAGEAAFAIGDYTKADRYLQAAPGNDGTDRVRRVTRLVLTKDPLLPRLPTRERRLRLQEGLTRARTRLAVCAPPAAVVAADQLSNLAALALEAQAFDEKWRTLAPDRVPDWLDDGFRLAWRVEKATEGICGPPDELDQALLLIGRRYEMDRP